MNSIKCKESMLAFYAMMIKIQEIIERHAQISAGQIHASTCILRTNICLAEPLQS